MVSFARVQAFVTGSTHMYKIVLITSIVLIVAGMLLTTFSLFSPMWQIVDRPKLAEIHHHGLWWDCVVPDGTLIPLQYEGTAQTGMLISTNFS
ncbi:unnamed protein product [Haemonchus placei]|uniref:Col_cuticle_N domain-containing protein n=1 Tax=Haemonchus placei TaxID=6290 RepID=A0A0N4VY26_HAEPC|nr:unnamed protein product [Haemonchus placei]